MLKHSKVSPLGGWPVTATIAVVAYSAVLTMSPALWLCVVLVTIAAGIVAGLVTLVLLRAGTGEGWAYAAMVGCVVGSVVVMYGAYGAWGLLGPAAFPIAFVVVAAHLIAANRQRWGNR